MSNIEEILNKKLQEHEDQPWYVAGFNAALAVLKPELRSRDDKLNEVREAAELSEFIELAREKIQGNEDDWSDGFTDDAYVNAIKAAYPNEAFPRELKKISRHYRRWIWILMFGDHDASPQIQRLRNLLNNNRTAYHKFAKSMQSFYGLLSKNVHVSSFKIKYLRKEKLDYYLKFVGDDIREDISALLRSESKFIDS